MGTIKAQRLSDIISVTLIVILCLLNGSILHAEGSPLINLIVLEGNKKIKDEAIFANIKSRVGEPFSDETVREDIKKLYSIGYFDDVRVEIEPFEGGIKLIFILKERPTIISIDFQGNEEIETERLREQITITTGSIANPELIMDNVRKVISFYQSEGYWLAEVIPVIREASKDSVALTFQVNEGEVVKVRGINIHGNKALPDSKIKKAMKTRQWWLFSFLTGSGVYKDEEIKADIERIRELYHNHGYINVEVSQPVVRLSEDKKRLYLDITISEGEQYKMGRLDIEGNNVFTTEGLLKNLKSKTGDTFSRKGLKDDIDKIIDLYTERGYARVDVNPIINVDDEKRVLNVTLSINEGDIYRIGRIEITGNTKTRDKVIRREVRLDEGDVFNSKLLRRSYQRINNLDYFESVNITPVPRVKDKLIDLNVNVKEKMTGMLSLGGGYSSIDKFMFFGEITQRNLFGKGLQLSFRANLSSIRTEYNVSLTDPWFLDKPVSASFNIYDESFKFPDYDKRAKGFSLGLGKELSEYVRGNIRYQLEEADIRNVSEDASKIIKEQEGVSLTSSISPSIWRDTRDNYLDPRTGTRHALYTTIAGLGGDNYFVKGVIDSIWYLPLMWNTTLSLRGRIGYATGFGGKDLPLYERFYVGGINTVRGLGFGEGGPRDENGEKIGGDKELIFNAEYIFPLIEDLRLKGLVFFDAGRAFDDREDISITDLRPTAGVGFRWVSPFGPIRLEWGYNLDRQRDESDSKIEFSLGTIF
ncbi:MAG: outer membrane protein assembly factor BamA [Thermodesulfovibrionia bacterium]